MSSDSSDSDAESVVEVTDLTMLRRGRSCSPGEANYVYAPLATGEATVFPQVHSTPAAHHVPNPNVHSAKPKNLRNHDATDVSFVSKNKGSLPQLTQSNYCDGHNKRNSISDEKTSSGVNLNITPNSHLLKVSNKKKDKSVLPRNRITSTKSKITDHPIEREKSNIETSPPPKPPRVLISSDNSGLFPVPEVEGSKSPLHTAQTSIVSPSNSPINTSVKAPLAVDEISDSYYNGRRRNHMSSKAGDEGVNGRHGDTGRGNI